MGNSSSMLTQYDIEEVQEHCNYIFSQQEIVALYKRFCQLDRNSKGFISADEFLSIPEFSVNPLSQRLLKILDGLNFKDFVAFLSAFSVSTPLQQKIEFIFKVYDLDGKGKVSFDDVLQVLKDLTGPFISEKQREQVLRDVFEEAGYRKDGCLSVADFVKLDELLCKRFFYLINFSKEHPEISLLWKLDHDSGQCSILGSPNLKIEVEVPID